MKAKHLANCSKIVVIIFDVDEKLFARSEWREREWREESYEKFQSTKQCEMSHEMSSFAIGVNVKTFHWNTFWSLVYFFRHFAPTLTDTHRPHLTLLNLFLACIPSISATSNNKIWSSRGFVHMWSQFLLHLVVILTIKMIHFAVWLCSIFIPFSSRHSFASRIHTRIVFANNKCDVKRRSRFDSNGLFKVFVEWIEANGRARHTEYEIGNIITAIERESSWRNYVSGGGSGSVAKEKPTTMTTFSR